MISVRLPLMIVAGLAVSASLWWREQNRRRSVAARLRERNAVDLESFLQGPGAGASLEEVERFRKIVAEAFSLDARRLGPDDHIRRDLMGDGLSRQRQLFFVSRLEREFDCVLPPAETCMSMSAGELFEAVMEKR